MVNLEHIRKNIILKDGIYYFDYTASGLAYKDIEDKISNVLLTYANTHSDSSLNAIITQTLYEKSRSELKNSLQLDDSFYLLPCGFGSTSAIKKFQELLGLYIPPKTKARYNIKQPSNAPLVIVGPYEHHSNEVSFREALCDTARVRLGEKGEIDLVHLEQILKLNKNREIIASFSVCSNVTGIITDYKKIYNLVKKYNGIVALDAASFSAYKNVDCNYFDALFLSPHKLLGGVESCGLLAIKKELCDLNEPTFAGGGTVSYVSRTSHIYDKNIEQLEQAGTPPILELIRANLAYKLRDEIGKAICENENELCEYFEKRIQEIENLQLYTPLNLTKLPIFSFNIKGISPYDLAAILSKDFGIQTRAGCACAGPYGHELLKMRDNQKLEEKPGWLRVSLHYTHTFDDIDYFIDSLQKSIKKYHTTWAEEISMQSLF
ncbi:aminotransferase [Campylobacter pinnipediorum subsp. caledonicus]|uniref:aminotransferase class V-fold PLP-dependent enzyme n=1 Tax=Campylobacter pinnipediorum TaxID=1965231 RepID=UPI000994B7DB|nr:aminotransferase class V-fold PLP-dependent enzyme [Campylobacter pinnipediorum]AQW86004.1 cysteine sulfinate desulfinase [Campylobacter pinnipediorum subsp. caledonicus]OPA72257.1 aminotransferase [Campylobacter pinnipediorum subsp. caledonicus]